MRLRVADRVLAALAGLVLLAGCAGLIAQVFFGVDLIGSAARFLTSESLRARLARIGMILFLLLLGVYCVMILFRHRSRKDHFILQKNDNGELAISVKALENMVQKCLDQHHELEVQSMMLENQKDGLLILIRGNVAGGISIPLTIEALQRQVKQYVTACSGVEVKCIRVQIDASGQDAKDAPFAIAGPVSKPLLNESEERQTPARENPAPDISSVSPMPAQPVQTVVPPSMPPAAPETGLHSPLSEASREVEELQPEDQRPLHQRLFSIREEPCIVPVPPADNEESMNAPKESAEENAVEPSLDSGIGNRSGDDRNTEFSHERDEHGGSIGEKTQEEAEKNESQI